MYISPALGKKEVQRMTHAEKKISRVRVWWSLLTPHMAKSRALYLLTRICSVMSVPMEKIVVVWHLISYRPSLSFPFRIPLLPSTSFPIAFQYINPLFASSKTTGIKHGRRTLCLIGLFQLKYFMPLTNTNTKHE